MSEDTITTTAPAAAPTPEEKRRKVLIYRNTPGKLYAFRQHSNTMVTSCGAQVRVDKNGTPIPRVRASKKERLRARKKEKELRAKFAALMENAHGREREVRQIFVDKLNEWVAVMGRMPDDQEEKALTMVAIEALPPKVPTPAAATL